MVEPAAIPAPLSPSASIRQATGQTEPRHEEITMHPDAARLVELWAADRYRHAQHDKSSRPRAMLTAIGGRPRRHTTAQTLMPSISAAVLSGNRWEGEGTPMSTRDQFTPDEDPP
jgi:hypothetical protein